VALQQNPAVGPDAIPYRVLVAIRDERDLHPLLRLACALARARGGWVHLFTVTRGGTQPSWLKLPDDCHDVPVDVVVRAGKNVGAVILQELQQLEPDTLILGWSGRLNRGRYLLGRTLDPVIQAAPCDVIVLRGECVERMQRILIPVAGDPNAPRAFDIARALASEVEVTALYVALQRLGPAEVLLGQDVLAALVRDLHDPSHIHTRVVQAAGPVEGILGELVRGYDLLILGASGANIGGRFLFGEVPQAVLVNSPVPVMVVRYRLMYLRSFVQRIWVRIFGLVPKLTVQERAKVRETVRRGSQPSTDFFVLITLASAIASLGLLLNSPAVVIGAMLVAPLMSAILGMGLGIVEGDQRFFWRALSTTARGMFLAIFTGFVVGLVVPGASLTQEILGRASPTLLDLGVALISGATAAYAISRPDASAALAGVAIAAALAPPLTTVGIGLVLRRWWVAGGALLLFLTNMVSIVAAGGLTFFLLGFRPELDRPDRHVILRRGTQSIAVLLLLVTIPLGVLTNRSLGELRLHQAVESALHAELAQMPGAEMVHWEIASEGDDDTLHLDVTIRVPQTMAYQDARALQEMVARRLGRPVALSLSVVPTTWLRAYVSPAPTPTPWVLVVNRVGAMGLRVRYSPGGVVVGYLQEGTSVVVTGGPVTLKDRAWYRVFSAVDQMEGWVAGDYLAPSAIP
jgi:uncharacterized hydrophobic protein (TIGR00271 family)